MNAPQLTVDDAIGVIVEYVKKRPSEVRSYGYDVYLPHILNLYLIAKQPAIAGDRTALFHGARELSPIFYVPPAGSFVDAGSCGQACGVTASRSRTIARVETVIP